MRKGTKVKIKVGDYAGCEAWCEDRYGDGEGAQWLVEVDVASNVLVVVNERDLEQLGTKR